MAYFPAPIDNYFKTLRTINYYDSSIHEGHAYYSGISLEMSNDQAQDILFMLCSFQATHLALIIKSSFKISIEAWEEVEVSDTGTIIPIIAMNRLSSEESCAILYSDPTISFVSSSIKLVNMIIGHHDASGRYESGGELRGERTWILNPLKNYLLRITSLQGAMIPNNEVSVSLVWHEHPLS